MGKGYKQRKGAAHATSSPSQPVALTATSSRGGEAARPSPQSEPEVRAEKHCNKVQEAEYDGSSVVPPPLLSTNKQRGKVEKPGGVAEKPPSPHKRVAKPMRTVIVLRNCTVYGVHGHDQPRPPDRPPNSFAAESSAGIKLRGVSGGEGRSMRNQQPKGSYAKLKVEKPEAEAPTDAAGRKHKGGAGAKERRRQARLELFGVPEAKITTMPKPPDEDSKASKVHIQILQQELRSFDDSIEKVNIDIGKFMEDYRVQCANEIELVNNRCEEYARLLQKCSEEYAQAVGVVDSETSQPETETTYYDQYGNALCQPASFPTSRPEVDKWNSRRRNKGKKR